MSANAALLTKAAGYYTGMETDDGTVERIELRTDGHGLNGYYDVIYIYVEDRAGPWQALPAHNCDFWEYQE